MLDDGSNFFFFFFFFQILNPGVIRRFRARRCGYLFSLCAVALALALMGGGGQAEAAGAPQHGFGLAACRLFRFALSMFSVLSVMLSHRGGHPTAGFFLRARAHQQTSLLNERRDRLCEDS